MDVVNVVDVLYVVDVVPVVHVEAANRPNPSKRDSLFIVSAVVGTQNGIH